MFMFKIRRKSTDLLFEQNVKKVSFSERFFFTNCLLTLELDGYFYLSSVQ